MTMTLKFDNGDTTIKHVEFPDGIILGLTTRDSDNNILEQEPLYLINGFSFSYSPKAYLPEAKINRNLDFKEFESAKRHFLNYIESGLNNVPEIRLQRALERLGVGPDAKAYIKALIGSTKK